MAKVALCVIATNRYTEFVNPLLESADKYFLANQIQLTAKFGSDWLYTTKVDYHVFSNMPTSYNTARSVTVHYIEHEPWPMMTLKRYHIMGQVDWSGYDYVYYIDADMRFVAPVGDEIFGNLVAVQHPGYYRGGGDWEDRRESCAFTQKERRNCYLAGGFQGGSKYPEVMGYLATYIQLDERNGVIAKWHDESHWNALALRQHNLTVLPPSYCFPDNTAKARAWGISHFEPKILALEKNHKEYRA